MMTASTTLMPTFTLTLTKTLKGGFPKLLLTLYVVIRLRNGEDVQKKTVIHISPLIYWCVLLRIAFMSVTYYSSSVFIF